MHRLKSHKAPKAAMRFVPVVLTLLALLTTGCATQKANVPDPTYVNTLRIKITKVRNAITETRNTIAVSRGAPYLPELYVRLAELLSEEARYHYQLAYEREQRSSRILHVPQVRVLKEEAIGIYTTVQKRFPNSALGARVLFNIGHEHRELGNFDKMREALDKLVVTYPNTPLRADALLVLGDYHFDRNELNDSRKYYYEITKGNLDRLSGLGHYKLAWVWVNQGKCTRALFDFEKAIVRTQQWEDKAAKARLAPIDPRNATAQLTDAVGVTQQAIDVRREALVDLAYCYSRERPVATAVPYFRKMAYNRSTYLAGLAKLANRYRLMDNATGSISTTRELLKLGSADQYRLDDARTLFVAIKRSGSFNRLDHDLNLIGLALTRHYARVDVSSDQKKRLTEEFELYLRDLATRAQGRLEKFSDQEKRAAQAVTVAAAYQAYIDTFPKAEKLSEILLNQADVHTLAGHDLEAGLSAIRAASLLDDGSDSKVDALYDAIVAFQTSLGKPADRRQYERVTARAALRNAAQQLLRFNLTQDKARTVKFAIAQTYYDEGNHLEAIDKLSAVAYEFPGTKEGDASIQLVLDSYYTINDTTGLILAGRRFLGAESPASIALKAEIKPFVEGAEQQRLDELSLQAAGEDGGGLAVLEKFAIQYKGSDLGERAILNAFVVARAQGNTDKMYEIAQSISQNYPKSEQLPGVYASLAQTAIARFEYDQAVRYLKQAANVNPAQRIRLLMAAGELLEQLADEKGAEAVYQDALKSAQGPAKGEAMARLSALVERAGNADAITAKLGPLAEDGNPDLLARLGLAQLAKGENDAAETTLSRALSVEAAAPGDAQARAQYGQAEVLLATLNGYPNPDDIDLLEELIALVEVVEESYITAAQQGSPTFAAAALGRLSYASTLSAERLRKITLPAELSEADRAQIQEAMKTRVTNLEGTSKEALKACSNQAWSNRTFTPIVRQCLKGEPFKDKMLPFDKLSARTPKNPPAGIDELRQRLSKNPEDTEGLRELGTKFLDNNDPHVARLIFARAIQAGGGATEHNLLGIASYKANDLSGAFEAFSQAASSGLEAGRQNLIKMLKDKGLGAASKEVLERFPKGEPGGRQL